MQSSKMTYFYYAFGLSIQSNYPIPELSEGKQEAEYDITIHVDEKNMPNEIDTNESNSRGIFQFTVKDTASFHIHAGRSIKITPFPKADYKKIRVYLLGTAFGALLLQRRIFTLHASGINSGEGAILFAGRSGIGKSTLAAAWMKQGYPFITDDVAAIILSQENLPMVLPSYPQQRLWSQSLSLLQMEADGLETIWGREEKYAISNIVPFKAKELPIKAIIQIQTTSKQKGLTIQPITGAEKLKILIEETYRIPLIDYFGMKEWHFNICAEIAKRLPIYQLTRPKQGYLPQQLVTKLLDFFDEGEKRND